MIVLYILVITANLPISYEIDKRVSSRELIGTAQGSTSGAGPLRYFLLQVVRYGLTNRKRRSLDPNWENYALDPNVDDCSGQILAKYPEDRKKFCINHTTGEISTTQHYTTEQVGVTFTLAVRMVDISDNAFLSQSYAITIIDKCVNLRNVYNGYTAICEKGVVTGTTVDIVDKSNPSSSIYKYDVTFGQEATQLWLGALVLVYFDSSFSVGDKLKFRVGLDGHGVFGSRDVDDPNFDDFYIYLDNPLYISLNETVVRVKFYLNGNLTELPGFEVQNMEWRLIPDKDYCTVSNFASCSQYTENGLVEYLDSQSDCPDNQDDELMQMKFGNCAGGCS